MATKKSSAVKKPAAKKEAKSKPKPKASKKSVVMPLRSEEHTHAAMGDNSDVNQPLLDIVEEHELLEEQKRQIGKQQRELKAKAKTEHNIASKVFTAVINLRKLAPDARVQFEHGVAEMNAAIGYQFSLDLLGHVESEEDADAAAQMAADAADDADDE